METQRERPSFVMHTITMKMIPFILIMFILSSKATTPTLADITMLQALNRQGKALCSIATTWKVQLGMTSTTPNPWNTSLASCSVQNPNIRPVWCDYSGISCSSSFLVTNLTLSSQSLLGTLPKSIAQLNASLQSLDLSYNSLTGSLPSELANLGVYLIVVNLAGNNFTQHALTPLWKMKRLQWLDLSTNGLTGTIPTSLSTLTSLVELNLAFSTLHGTIPTFLGTLTNLQFLDLSQNALTGPIPASVLSGWSGMSMLSLHSNSLVGSLPSSMSSLRQLQGLYLDHNGFIGSVPSFLSSLSALTTLHLEQNQFVGHLTMNPVSSWTMLQELHLEGNMLRGTLPNAIFANMASSLSVLNLEMNTFSGTFPSSLSSLVSLIDVKLGANNFTRQHVPSFLSKLSALTAVCISSANLFGTLPPFDANVVNTLMQLRLDSNALSGTLPMWLGDLTSLTELRLDRNYFQGTVPSTLVQLTSLKVLNLNENYLVGPFPVNGTAFTDDNQANPFEWVEWQFPTSQPTLLAGHTRRPTVSSAPSRQPTRNPTPTPGSSRAPTPKPGTSSAPSKSPPTLAPSSRPTILPGLPTQQPSRPQTAMIVVTQTISLPSGNSATPQTKIKQAVVAAAASAMGISQSAIAVTSVTSIAPTSSPSPVPVTRAPTKPVAVGIMAIDHDFQQKQPLGPQRRSLLSAGAIVVYTAVQANGNTTALKNRLNRAVAIGTFTTVLAQTITGASASLPPVVVDRSPTWSPTRSPSSTAPSVMPVATGGVTVGGSSVKLSQSAIIGIAVGGFILVVCLAVACCSNRCRARLFGYAAADNANTNHDHPAVSTFSANTNASRVATPARGTGPKQKGQQPVGETDEWSHTLNDDEEGGGRGHGISSLVASGQSKTRTAKEVPLQPLLSPPPVDRPSPSSSSQQKQRQQQRQQEQPQQDTFDFSMENPLKFPPSYGNLPAVTGFAADHSRSGHPSSHTDSVIDPFANTDPFASSSSPLMDDLAPFTNVPLTDQQTAASIMAGSRATSKVPPVNPFQTNPNPNPPATNWDWLDQGGAAPLPKAPSQRRQDGFGGGDHDVGGL